MAGAARGQLHPGSVPGRVNGAERRSVNGWLWQQRVWRVQFSYNEPLVLMTDKLAITQLLVAGSSLLQHLQLVNVRQH